MWLKQYSNCTVTTTTTQLHSYNYNYTVITTITQLQLHCNCVSHSVAQPQVAKAVLQNVLAHTCNAVCLRHMHSHHTHFRSATNAAQAKTTYNHHNSHATTFKHHTVAVTTQADHDRTRQTMPPFLPACLWHLTPPQQWPHPLSCPPHTQKAQPPCSPRQGAFPLQPCRPHNPKTKPLCCVSTGSQPPHSLHSPQPP